MAYPNRGTGTHQGVGIEEDTLGELDKLPTVELREGDAELGPLQQLQVLDVLAVQDFDVDDLVEGRNQLCPEKIEVFEALRPKRDMILKQ